MAHPASTPAIPAHLRDLTHLKIGVPAAFVLLVTINRPKHLNLFDGDTEEEMRRVLEWVDADDDVWVIVLTGEGPTFCAGGDLTEALHAMRTRPHEPIPDTVFHAPTDAGLMYLSRNTTTLKPIIAAVNGLALGGGAEIVINCDIVVASEKARFVLLEVKNGLVAAKGAIPRLARIAGHQLAAEAYMTGRGISAKDARDRFGFVNRVVPHDQVMSTALEIASDIINMATRAGQAHPDPRAQHAASLAKICEIKRGLINALRNDCQRLIYDIGYDRNASVLYQGFKGSG